MYKKVLKTVVLGGALVIGCSAFAQSISAVGSSPRNPVDRAGNSYLLGMHRSGNSMDITFLEHTKAAGKPTTVTFVVYECGPTRGTACHQMTTRQVASSSAASVPANTILPKVDVVVTPASPIGHCYTVLMQVFGQVIARTDPYLCFRDLPGITFGGSPVSLFSGI
jgi:hypothetical protein